MNQNISTLDDIRFLIQKNHYNLAVMAKDYGASEVDKNIAFFYSISIAKEFCKAINSTKIFRHSRRPVWQTHNFQFYYGVSLTEEQ
ncbi:MAG: hypothetical protein AABY07_05450 [Nanoarchaeota archaeon]